MFGFYELRNQYTLWKFLIDEKYQNKGYGKMALALGIEYMKKQYDIKEMYTGVAIDNDVAERLYHSVGFQLTGLIENGMKELRYVCKL
ncbi:gCN5-related N-acetyltransferase [Firmicutes bacterium CAG:94]|nr:gCN5-related N-acetyltransferase [Firmicutes bacterium CAG:94]